MRKRWNIKGIRVTGDKEKSGKKELRWVREKERSDKDREQKEMRVKEQNNFGYYR
jgi:hypothetical protein